MGYESRLIIVDRNEYDMFGDKCVIAEEIARIDLCCLGWRWNLDDVFKTPIDFDIKSNASFGEHTIEINTKIDYYGKVCCMAKPKEVINALEKMRENEDYRRFSPAIMLLKGFDESKWKDIRVVHFGY